jgi:hypothetical protein
MRRNKESVIWVKNYLNELGQKLFKQTASILSVLHVSKFVYEHYVDLAPKVCYFRQLFVAIFEDVLSFDPGDVGFLTIRVPLLLDLPLKKSCAHIERDTLGHIPNNHDHFPREQVFLDYSTPVVFSQVKLLRVDVVCTGKLLIK